MSEPRKHPVVPQLYQKGFARKQGKGWYAVVLNRETSEARHPSNIRDIFAERDYNTITDANGNRDFRAERLLSDHVETAAKHGLDGLRAGEFPLSDTDRQQVAIFMAAQLSRGRALRNNFSEGLSEAMSLALSLSARYSSDEHFESVLGYSLSAAQRERLLHNKEHMTIQPTNATLLKASLSTVGEIAEMLLIRTWTLVAFAEPCLFTGEHPVVHINPHGDSTGYGALTAERLYMPASTNTGLVLSHPWAGCREAAINGSVKMAERLNWAMLTHPSNRELLLHPDIARHPLPSLSELAKDIHWPWGPDPASAPPVHMTYGRARHVPPPLGLSRFPG